MAELRQTNLIFKLGAPNRRATRSIAELAVSGLNHKVFDYSMEDAAVVVLILAVGKEVLAGFWTFLWIYFNLDFAH